MNQCANRGMASSLCECLDCWKLLNSLRKKNPIEGKVMGYVIKLNHRKGGPTMYLGAVPVATDHDDDQVRAMEREGLRVEDFETTSFGTLEEASEFPYPTAEAATGAISILPETKNIDYEVVAIGDDLDESMESGTTN